MIDETQRRFLRAITEQIPLDRLVEVHLFPPIRQSGVESGVAVVAALPEADAESTRHVVFSARYRLTIKGSERGKWEVSVVPEADAPLVTVEAVVLGVQRRAGELSAAERLTADEVRSLLDEASWPATTR